MQLLHDASNASNASVSAEACARELLDTLPMGMRIIRKHMRQHRSGLTVPQFRTLCFLTTSPGSSLSTVADFIGLSLPAMSRLVDGMVEKHLMERRPCDDDRRQVRLSVTPRGETAIHEARELAQTQLAEAVARLTPAQRGALVDTMKVLRQLFAVELDGAEGSADGEAAVVP